MGSAFFQRLSTLRCNYFGDSIEHGQEWKANALFLLFGRQGGFAFFQKLLGIRGRDVDHHCDVLVVQKLTNLGILLAQTVQLVTPASALEAKHHKHAHILPLGLCGRRINLSTSVRLRVISGGLFGFSALDLYLVLAERALSAYYKHAAKQPSHSRVPQRDSHGIDLPSQKGSRSPFGHHASTMQPGYPFSRRLQSVCTAAGWPWTSERKS